MTKTDKHPKEPRNVTVWMTDSEYEELGRECAAAVRGVPGAKLSRSAFLAELFRQHLKSKVKES